MSRRGRPLVGRKRDRYFVKAVKRFGLPQNDDEKRALVAATWPSMDEYDQKVINRKIRQKLAQPDIKRALRDIYEDVGGFTEGEATMLHIQHIRGFPRQVEVREEDGSLSIETVTEKPNYQALKDYRALMGWEPEKRVRVDQRNLNLNMTMDSNAAGPVQRDGPPPTRARAILSGDVLPGPKVGTDFD